MGRPAKSVKVKSGAIAGDDAAIRQDMENKLRGENTPPDPPACLTDEQREIFQFIVDGLAESEILGRLDVFVLESTAVAIDRLHAINNMIDANPAAHHQHSAAEQPGQISERSVERMQRAVPLPAGPGQDRQSGRAKAEGEKGPPNGGPERG